MMPYRAFSLPRMPQERRSSEDPYPTCPSGISSLTGESSKPAIMTIRFEVCPYHEPHPAGFERTMVVDDWSRRFKCAACGAEGFLDAEDQFPMFDEFWKDFDKEAENAKA